MSTESTDNNIPPSIKIDRPLYEHNQLREDLNYEKIKKGFTDQWCQNVSCKKLVTGTIPALGWVPKYQWKTDILADLAAGFTVAVMHIPQGMAYALLGNVPPVVGIYMAVFPVLVYFFFGTSRHVSQGTFSIACLMTGKAVLEYSDPSFFRFAKAENATSTVDIIETTGFSYTPLQVACTVTLVAAFVQLVMYFLRLGAASALLSDMLVNAFTAGAACQIVVTQIKDLLGLSIPKHKGNFLTTNTLSMIFQNIGDSSVPAIIISAITIVVLVLNNEFLKPFVAKKTSVPIPIEIIIVVIGALLSQQLDLVGTYGIKAVGNIPTGFPDVAFPPISLIPSVIPDGISVAIVSYVTSLSLGLMLAQKAHYEIDPNQELLAMGASNIVGSMFSCMPVCASLSRSQIQQVVGGRTQLVSIISASLLIIILQWIAPFFEPLPTAVLASVIVVSLKGMLMQIGQVVNFWRLSKLDALVWIVTFLTVVFVSMEIGLAAGVAMSLFSIFIFSFRPYTSLLGSVPGSDLYLDINRYKGAKELEGMKIFHYCGGINFATKNIFREELYKLIDLDTQKQLVFRAKLKKLQEKLEKSDKKDNEKVHKLECKINTTLKCLIMDFSSATYIDPSGAAMLKSEVNNFKNLDIALYIAACPDRVYNTLDRCGLISKEKDSIRIFSSVHDAVQSASYDLHLNEENGISTITKNGISSSLTA